MIDFPYVCVCACGQWVFKMKLIILLSIESLPYKYPLWTLTTIRLLSCRTGFIYTCLNV